MKTMRKAILLLVCGLALHAAAPYVIVSTTKLVTTAGTAVALGPAFPEAAWVTVQALSTNTGVVCVGGPTVLVSTKNGTCLTAGQAAPMNPGGSLYSFAAIYVDAAVNGEGVSYTYAR